MLSRILDLQPLYIPPFRLVGYLLHGLSNEPLPPDTTLRSLPFLQVEACYGTPHLVFLGGNMVHIERCD